jgi:glycosyltransferase involved in cell wall biosynthesis
MKVSIITISYNAAETIAETIASVSQQTYPDIEYIVVDGASNDGTKDIIESCRASIQTYISEPDKGIYDAMNKGISLAKGELIGILNADDVYAHPQVVSRIVDAMQKTHSDACYADLQYVDRKNPNKTLRHWEAGEYERSAFLKGWMPPHPTFFIKRKCYEQMGLYRAQMKISADYELMLRMLYKHNVKTAYLNEVAVKMKAGGESNVSLKNRLKANREDRLAWKVNQLKPGKFTFLMKPLGKITQFFKR